MNLEAVEEVIKLRDFKVVHSVRETTALKHMRSDKRIGLGKRCRRATILGGRQCFEGFCLASVNVVNKDSANEGKA